MKIEGYNYSHIEALLGYYFVVFLLPVTQIPLGSTSVKGQATMLALTLHSKHIHNIWKIFLTDDLEQPCIVIPFSFFFFFLPHLTPSLCRFFCVVALRIRP